MVTVKVKAKSRKLSHSINNMYYRQSISVLTSLLWPSIEIRPCLANSHDPIAHNCTTIISRSQQQQQPPSQLLHWTDQPISTVEFTFFGDGSGLGLTRLIPITAQWQQTSDDDRVPIVQVTDLCMIRLAIGLLDDSVCKSHDLVIWIPWRGLSTSAYMNTNIPATQWYFYWRQARTFTIRTQSSFMSWGKFHFTTYQHTRVSLPLDMNDHSCPLFNVCKILCTTNRISRVRPAQEVNPELLPQQKLPWQPT